MGKTLLLPLKMFCARPCLTFPMINKTYILETDASHSAIGCVLSHIQDGTEKVISYGSKKLSKSERAYSVTSFYQFIFLLRTFNNFFLVQSFEQCLQCNLNHQDPQLKRNVKICSLTNLRM